MTSEFGQLQRTIVIWRERHDEAVMEQVAKDEAISTMSAQLKHEVKMSNDRMSTSDAIQWQQKLYSQEEVTARLSMQMKHEIRMSDELSDQMSELRARDASQSRQKLLAQEEQTEKMAAKQWLEHTELKSELSSYHEEILSLTSDICALQDENSDLHGKNFVIHSGDEAQDDEEWPEAAAQHRLGGHRKQGPPASAPGHLRARRRHQRHQLR